VLYGNLKKSKTKLNCMKWLPKDENVLIQSTLHKLFYMDEVPFRCKICEDYPDGSNVITEVLKN
jgi:hypothetical protein